MVYSCPPIATILFTSTPMQTGAEISTRADPYQAYYTNLGIQALVGAAKCNPQSPSQLLKLNTEYSLTQQKTSFTYKDYSKK